MYCGNIHFLYAIKVQFYMPVVGFIGIFTYNFKNIVVNKIAFTAVDSKYTVCRYLVQCFFKVYFVEERNVAVEFDIIHFGFVLFGFGDLVFRFKIIADDKINGDE
jgi:carbon starvation protein CstA